MSLKLSASSSPRIRLLVLSINKLIAGSKTEDEACYLKEDGLSCVVNATRMTSVGLMLTAEAATSEVEEERNLNVKTDKMREGLKADLRRERDCVKSLKSHTGLSKRPTSGEEEGEILKSKLTQKSVSVLIEKNC
jgi:hypothetical protein